MLKKKRYKLLCFLLILSAMLFLCRTYLFCTFVSYKNIGQRVSYAPTDKELINCIEKQVKIEKKLVITEIIPLSLEITAQKLTFTAGKNDNDPNKLIHSQKAHCVGYAAFLATTCNYLLKKNQLASEWVAKPCIGQLYFLGINVHPYFDTPFFKDHDFVIVENKKTKEVFAIDATIYDYLGINAVRLK